MEPLNAFNRLFSRSYGDIVRFDSGDVLISSFPLMRLLFDTY